ncbi:MAG: hypothetical protein LBI12_01170 [Treponema sp.]|nr:hypothetical protein [Treponema sp.]
MKKTPRFFCDNCGEEVGHEVKSCPHCGRFFASVRCPSCTFTGEERMFLNGCPSCGYSAIPVKSKGYKKMKYRDKKHIHGDHHISLAYIAAGVLLLAFIALFSWFITR